MEIITTITITKKVLKIEIIIKMNANILDNMEIIMILEN